VPRDCPLTARRIKILKYTRHATDAGVAVKRDRDAARPTDAAQEFHLLEGACTPERKNFPHCTILTNPGSTRWKT